MTNQPHSVQVLDGSDITVQIAALALPNRVMATRNTTTGLLSYMNQPDLWVSGSTDGKLLEMAGSSEFNTTFGKTNKSFRLFNDSGWEQDKITGRNWQATMQGLFLRNTSIITPDLEDSFKIIFENALSKEEEVYIKFLKFLGVIAATAPIAVTVTNATDLITFPAAHGLSFGSAVTFAAGTVPAGLAVATNYYAIVISATTIKVAATYANAIAIIPVPIDITTDGATVTATIPARKRYQVEGGNAKVINFGDQAMADGILQVSATLKGQGSFVYGFDEVAV
jgi:hypothetical protein